MYIIAIHDRAIVFIMPNVFTGTQHNGECSVSKGANPDMLCPLFVNSQWSSDGVVLLNENATHYTCQSSHLTSFAVLVSIHPVPVKFLEINVVAY